MNPRPLDLFIWTLVFDCLFKCSSPMYVSPADAASGGVESGNSTYPADDYHSDSDADGRLRSRRHIPARCHPDPRSPDLHRRSICPYEIIRDLNEFRVPDLILRARCLCEHSHCSDGSAGVQGHSRCVALVSPLKVAYLQPSNVQRVVATEIVQVPVACICASQPAGRHMPSNRNIVV